MYLVQKLFSHLPHQFERKYGSGYKQFLNVDLVWKHKADITGTTTDLGIWLVGAAGRVNDPTAEIPQRRKLAARHAARDLAQVAVERQELDLLLLKKCTQNNPGTRCCVTGKNAKFLSKGGKT